MGEICIVNPLRDRNNSIRKIGPHTAQSIEDEKARSDLKVEGL